jgi:dipeptide/tripeptide permease
MLYIGILVGLALIVYGTRKFLEAKRKNVERLLKRYGALSFAGVIIASACVCGIVIEALGQNSTLAVLIVEFIVVTIATAIYIKPGYMKDV